MRFVRAGDDPRGHAQNSNRSSREQVPNVYTERFRELHDVEQRDVPLTAFDRPDVGSMESGTFAQFLLRKPSFVTALPDPFTEGREGR